MPGFEEQHTAESDRSQRLSKLADQAIKEMPIDETAGTARLLTDQEQALVGRSVETTKEIIGQQLAVLEALGLVSAGADSHQITTAMKQRAFEKCRDLFGNRNDPTQRAPGAPAPFMPEMPEPQPDPNWASSSK